MIIFLSGSINAGKTTISHLLAAKLPKAIVIEVDGIDLDKKHLPIDDRIQLRLERVAVKIKAAESRYENIIVPNPISRENFDFLVKELAECWHKIVAVTLDPGLELALTDRGERDLDDWERERIKHHYKIGIHTPDFGIIIDNSRYSPAETVEAILKQISYADRD